MTGHWELMGLEVKKPFKTFTETGFPPELIAELEKRTGHKIIGNKSASGTEILDELGEEEIATGHMIVYTSADSVLQISGNEETFGLDEPVVLDLGILVLTFGLSVRITIASIIGMVLAIIIYRFL